MSASISTYCVVFGCPNKGTLQRSNTTVTFHRFPNKQSDASCERHEKWLKKINREHFIPKPRSVVCSLHFTANLFRPNGKLVGNAVPTLYMGSPPKHDKQLADKGVQCEMGRETFRSQSGVNNVTSQENEEYGDENNPVRVKSTQNASLSSYSIDKALEHFPFVNVENIKEEKDILISPDTHESFMDVQCNMCTCGECGVANLETIIICCDQIGIDDLKNNHTSDHNCIAFDENFETIVLDFHVIMTSLQTMITLCPPDDTEYCNLLKGSVDNRLCRHVAYHQFRSWINSRLNLGINKIKLIPTCVLHAVRQRFPEDDNMYQELLSSASNGQETKLEYFD